MERVSRSIVRPDESRLQASRSPPILAVVADEPDVRVATLDLEEVKLAVVAVSVEQELAELTAAEREVVRLVLDGCSNREIAKRRGASVKTIANQLAAVYQKLGICSRYELAARLGR